MMKFLEGKRTYATMAIIAVLGGIGALNQAGVTHIIVPDWAFSVLAAVGVYTRAIAKPK